MRTLMKVTFDVTASNKAILNGGLPNLLKDTMQRLQPEAAYFLPSEGKRSCMMVFDLKDPADIPAIAEPFFLEMNAEVVFSPVMNADDLQKGLEQMQHRQMELSHN